MKTHQLIGAALFFIGGFGGLANALAYMSMIDSLNTQRSPNEQIPLAIVSWSDRRLYRARGLSYWRILGEFREQFPHDRRYHWHLVSLVWMFCFFSAGAIAMLAF